MFIENLFTTNFYAQFSEDLPKINQIDHECLWTDFTAATAVTIIVPNSVAHDRIE